MTKIKNAVAHTKAQKMPGLDADKIESGAISHKVSHVDSFDMDSASTDDLDTGEMAVVKLVPDAASRELSGIVAPDNELYARKLLINDSDEDLIIKSQDNSSAAANRFLGGGEGDFFLQSGRGVEIIYDFAETRWRILANNEVGLT